MAAMSAAPAAATTLTPPSSSHGNQDPWSYPAAGNTENSIKRKKSITSHDAATRSPLIAQNGNAAAAAAGHGGAMEMSRKQSSGELASSRSRKNSEGYFEPLYGSDRPIRPSRTNSEVDVNGTTRNNGPSEERRKRTTSDLHEGGTHLDENSKWIHRDKLARIESEELQAAGIVLPRSMPRPRRDKSSEKLNGHRKTSEGSELAASKPKSAATAEQRALEVSVPAWDLRLPEEIALEAENSYWTSVNGGKGGSRIPVAKLSPVPIPLDFIERESPSTRKTAGLGFGDGDSISYPKPRSRSASMKGLEGSPGAVQQARRAATDISPKKTNTRKNSTNAKGGAPGRPKTRSGPNKDSTSSSGTNRPNTRSGELSPGIKQPEGDPPWMVSAYKPDPRLPPDQQLLPTVARRLQQEKWEKEGFLQPPELEPGRTEQGQDDWPLKAEGPRSPGVRQGSYSTMPKIQDKPPVSPIPSPRSPQVSQMTEQQQTGQRITSRVPEDPEGQKGGCGCCVVM